MKQLLALPLEYSAYYLKFDRVFPLIDRKLQDLIIITNKGRQSCLDISSKIMNVDDEYIDDLFFQFKRLFQTAIEASSLNTILNLNSAVRADICLGCTQYIDSLYMRYGPTGIQVLEREYTYHQRLNPTLNPVTIKNLKPRVPLIISQPFFYGTTHLQMNEILDQCLELNIPVHIDGAWITACRNIFVDFNHPAISSFAISMSKGYGLSGWNRIGVRWTKETIEDAITVMNDYTQIPTQAVTTGIYFLNSVQPDHLWLTHKNRYNKICANFDLETTDSIHLAMKDGNPIGIESLIRFLEDND
jgi:hypothetical protein